MQLPLANRPPITYITGIEQGFKGNDMGMSAQEIESLVKEAFPDAVIELTDLAGDNDHYSIVVTSASFQGKTRVAQHKMVFDALKGGMGSRLHALAVTTRVP